MSSPPALGRRSAQTSQTEMCLKNQNTHLFPHAEPSFTISPPFLSTCFPSSKAASSTCLWYNSCPISTTGALWRKVWGAAVSSPWSCLFPGWTTAGLDLLPGPVLHPVLCLAASSATRSSPTSAEKRWEVVSLYLLPVEWSKWLLASIASCRSDRPFIPASFPTAITTAKVILW